MASQKMLDVLTALGSPIDPGSNLGAESEAFFFLYPETTTPKKKKSLQLGN